MKYIKTFEYNPLKYKIGDYVKISPKYFDDKKPRFAKIVEIDKSNIPYLVQFTDNTTSVTLWINDNLIIDYLNDEEIEQYELEIDLKNFNL